MRVTRDGVVHEETNARGQVSALGTGTALYGIGKEAAKDRGVFQLAGIRSDALAVLSGFAIPPFTIWWARRARRREFARADALVRFERLDQIIDESCAQAGRSRAPCSSLSSTQLEGAGVSGASAGGKGRRGRP